LKRFGLKKRNDFSKNILTKDTFKKIKDFNKKENVIVRKADKNNTFVIMKREDYYTKITKLISDPNKFKESKKDPTEQIKKDLNKLISQSNNILPKVKGHFEPGYIYGNPKTHKDKNNPPLRPIISQIGTVTYETAKKLNDIINPFMPKEHMINSTNEFIEITKTVSNPKMLASLDVVSLFTNVPVHDTIEIILNNVYNHPNLPAPNIPSETLR